MRTKADKEIKELRSDVGRQERRLQQKEETLDRKIDNIERKDEQAQNRLKQAEEKLKEAEVSKKPNGPTGAYLRTHGGTGQTTAAGYLEGELVHEKALKIQNAELQLKDEAGNQSATLFPSRLQDVLQIPSQRRPFRSYRCPMTK